MTISFDRPIGAPADVKELEYVSALTQTCMPDLRVNGRYVGGGTSDSRGPDNLRHPKLRDDVLVALSK